jgi:hypothetical protein
MQITDALQPGQRRPGVAADLQSNAIAAALMPIDALFVLLASATLCHQHAVLACRMVIAESSAAMRLP